MKKIIALSAVLLLSACAAHNPHGTYVAASPDGERIDFFIHGERMAHLNDRGFIVEGPILGTAFEPIEAGAAPKTKKAVKDGADCSKAGMIARDTDGDVSICVDDGQ
ncbi:MAG: hypothetical protein H6920_09845 [Sphingomonadaceae bacterium]|nr:hypothetical protein [Novosphingobium sp.]MCP5391907.1 hypothetical protein [Sphingomonadaceae bacterium]